MRCVDRRLQLVPAWPQGCAVSFPASPRHSPCHWLGVLRYGGMFGTPGLGVSRGVFGWFGVMRRDSMLGVMGRSGVFGVVRWRNVLDVRGPVRVLGRLRMGASGMMDACGVARARGMARRGVGWRGRDRGHYYSHPCKSRITMGGMMPIARANANTMSVIPTISPSRRRHTLTPPPADTNSASRLQCRATLGRAWRHIGR